VGDASTFKVLGTPNCGKGEPNQVIRVGHASPACVFSDVDVFGGRRLMKAFKDQGVGRMAQAGHRRWGTAIHPGLRGEVVEFVRFNKGKVRQAGQVQQASLSLKLINDGRHADVSHHPGR
jgi:predicted Zn-dependent protease